jgi:hypothetical protein
MLRFWVKNTIATTQGASVIVVIPDKTIITESMIFMLQLHK